MFDRPAASVDDVHKYGHILRHLAFNLPGQFEQGSSGPGQELSLVKRYELVKAGRWFSTWPFRGEGTGRFDRDFVGRIARHKYVPSRSGLLCPVRTRSGQANMVGYFLADGMIAQRPVLHRPARVHSHHPLQLFGGSKKENAILAKRIGVLRRRQPGGKVDEYGRLAPGLRGKRLRNDLVNGCASHLVQTRLGPDIGKVLRQQSHSQERDKCCPDAAAPPSCRKGESHKYVAP